MPDAVPQSLQIPLPTEADTSHLGVQLARLLQPGDTVLLDGPIGAGKTHLARALIRARLGRAEDVPSPTFTLVQTYVAAGTEIWHADLYRLTHPDEVWELGLDDAFVTAICLVEWPDRLGRHVPEGALRVGLSDLGLSDLRHGRLATLTGGRSGLLAALRDAQADA